jgi:hypothetical protein
MIISKYSYNIAVLILTLFSLQSYQCSTKVYTGSSGNFYEESGSIIYTVSEIIIPEVIINSYRMRDFIASDYFSEYKKKNNDIKSVEEIYDYALWLTDYNIEQSLFIISIATLPYKKTPAKFPILKFDMMFYFSLESDSMFRKRYNNLPSQLFPDSPKNLFGDKDKTPHFFGSAFLAYISDSKSLSTLVGVIIELGESIFQLEGFMDERDIRANELGAEFGKRLLRNFHCRPSEFFRKLK